MDRLKAHATLAFLPAPLRPELPVEWAGPPDVDAWPALAVALASLSGWLEEAEDEAALLLAVDHGCSLALGGVVSLGAIRREVYEVVAEVMSAGAQEEREAGNVGLG